MKNIFTFTFFILLALSSKAQLDNGKLLDYIESQHYKEAAAYLESVFPNGTDDPKIIHRLAYSYLMSGDLPKAETNFQVLLQQDSTNISVLNSLATIANKRGNYNQVIQFYNKIYDLDSTNFYIVKQMAYAQQKAGNGNEFIKYLKKASKLNAKDPDIAYDLSDLYIKQNLYKDADSIINLALKADSVNLVLLTGRLMVKGVMNDFKEVVNTGEKIFALGDSTAEVENKTAIAYYYLKNYPKSLALMKSIETKDLANETTFYYIGLNYRKLGQLDLSNNYLNLAIEDGISDNISIYYQELGRNRKDLKQFTTSIYDYKKAQEYRESNYVDYSIARIYDADLNQPEKALIYYQKYIKKADPRIQENQPYINFCIERIKQIKGK